jgi:sugar lactone lactonase YvrE
MLTVDPAEVTFIGAGLTRPECVLTTRSGDLFISDRRGGISQIHPDGRTEFIEARNHPDGFMPNGIALMPNRDVMIANLGAAGGVWRMTLDGDITLVLSEIDGKPLPPPNFVGLDRAGRLWITVSTWQLPREKAFAKGFADGFIIVMDDAGARIVAEGIGFTNEAVVDPTGQWLYVNETIGRQTLRFPIHGDGSLGPREVVATFPPATFPDGLTFDAEGGVWIVSVASNRVIRSNRQSRALSRCIGIFDPIPGSQGGFVHTSGRLPYGRNGHPSAIWARLAAITKLREVFRWLFMFCRRTPSAKIHRGRTVRT